MDNKEIPFTPATPGTPGAPLFSGFKSKKARNGIGIGIGRKSLLKDCKCVSVEKMDLRRWSLAQTLLFFATLSYPYCQKVGAEFIGTFVLMFAGTTTAIVNQKINPAVTISFAALKYFPLKKIIHRDVERQRKTHVYPMCITPICTSFLSSSRSARILASSF
ncbi:Aquaporin-like [Sesbania bispinosa]|nr:Aquaporin-like [Sesbania bispinosa]